jgi:hypothetical protein
MREDAGCEKNQAGVKCIKRRDGNGKVTGPPALRLCRGTGPTYHVLNAAEKVVDLRASRNLECRK